MLKAILDSDLFEITVRYSETLIKSLLKSFDWDFERSIGEHHPTMTINCGDPYGDYHPHAYCDGTLEEGYYCNASMTCDLCYPSSYPADLTWSKESNTVVFTCHRCSGKLFRFVKMYQSSDVYSEDECAKLVNQFKDVSKIEYLESKAKCIVRDCYMYLKHPIDVFKEYRLCLNILESKKAVYSSEQVFVNVLPFEDVYENEKYHFKEFDFFEMNEEEVQKTLVLIKKCPSVKDVKGKVSRDCQLATIYFDCFNGIYIDEDLQKNLWNRRDCDVSKIVNPTFETVLHALKIPHGADVLSHAGSKALGINWIEVNRTVYRKYSRRKSIDKFYVGLFKDNAIFAIEDLDFYYCIYDRDAFLAEIKAPENEELYNAIAALPAGPIPVADSTTDATTITKSSFF